MIPTSVQGAMKGVNATSPVSGMDLVGDKASVEDVAESMMEKRADAKKLVDDAEEGAEMAKDKLEVAKAKREEAAHIAEDALKVQTLLQAQLESAYMECADMETDSVELAQAEQAKAQIAANKEEVDTLVETATTEVAVSTEEVAEAEAVVAEAERKVDTTRQLERMAMDPVRISMGDFETMCVGWVKMPDALVDAEPRMAACVSLKDGTCPAVFSAEQRCVLLDRMQTDILSGPTKMMKF